MIPDDEPWWKVRETIDGRSMPTAAAIGAIGDRYMADKVCHGTCPLAAEPSSETLQTLDALPFRPIGYEW